MFVDFGMAAQYGGHCYLRFDDTNPEAEKQEYIDHIQEIVGWLGWKPWKVRGGEGRWRGARDGKEPACREQASGSTPSEGCCSQRSHPCGAAWLPPGILTRQEGGRPTADEGPPALPCLPSFLYL